jgi:uncharacterized membrane protein
MPDFSVMGYLATKLVAERQELPPERVKQLSIVGAVIGLTPTWLVVADTIARREAPAGSEGEPEREHK